MSREKTNSERYFEDKGFKDGVEGKSYNEPETPTFLDTFLGVSQHKWDEAIAYEKGYKDGKARRRS